MDDALRRHTLRARCTRDLSGHGRVDPADHLARLPADIQSDWYASGGVVDELEEAVAELLGKPAVAFMPSGTMAQQIALRLHAEAAGSPVVLAHPLMHPRLHEDEPLERLHGLIVRPVGEADRLLDVADLAAVAEPAGSLLIELPQREIGSPLPTWEQLAGQVAWARERGMALHLDGARLWESQPFYGRPLADIAGLFDTIYVSFYKGLGAVGGAALAGEDDLIALAREWRHRLGGQLVMQWPLAASALTCLRERLPRIPDYVTRMAQLALALDQVPGIRVRHGRSFTNAVHLLLDNDVASVRARIVELAATEAIWTVPVASPTDVPGWTRIEVTIGDAAMAVPVDAAVRAFSHLLRPIDGARTADQLVEVVDEHGAITDVVTRARIRAEGLWHRATYVAVVTDDDELIVHRRSDDKDVNAGLWDLVFGGICDVGEDWADAAARELEEEAGITGAELAHLGQFSWQASDPGDGGKVVGRAYLTRWDGPVTAQDGEVAEFARVPLAGLQEWAGQHEICEDSRVAVLPELLRHLT